ncbi:MAG TPA: carboxypeptidase-like regulatory domain-containing protein, partial [Polyangia bacterium]|nr:carboxypeptidase-like regulatory domain-containing protein [Polyangia bacterium]
TTGPDNFSTATATQCVRALAGDDTLMVGPRGLVLGGPGNDNINGFTQTTVIPGPGLDSVSVSGGSTVKIQDLCEVVSGENFFGGGDGTLVTPVPTAQLVARGMTLNGFSTVVIQKNSCKSSCVTKPDCSGHGQCAEGAAAGQVVCACNIDWTGTHCETPVTVNTGATAGPLTISGRVTDPAGTPVVGAKIVLGGAVQALRFSDFTGGYVFHVSAGSYTLATAGGDCGLSPGSVNLGNVTSNKVQNFATSTTGCSTAARSEITATGELLTVVRGAAVLGLTIAHIEQLPTAADALARLQAIADENSSGLRSLTIAGSPAIERQVVIPLGESETGGTGDEEQLALTTAIALGPTLVRFESRLEDAADPATISRFFNAGRNLAPEDVGALHGPAPQTRALVVNPPAAVPPIALVQTPSSVDQLFGELQVAASDSENAVVYATQKGAYFSNDAGKTVARATVFVGPAFGGNRGDPSVALGAPDATGHQAFYFSRIVEFTGGGALGVAVHVGTSNGQTFNATGTPYPVDCRMAATCTVPDQPQLAADHHNRTASGDQLYLAFRNFRRAGAMTVNFGTTLLCSSDGGASWGDPDSDSLAMTGGDLARLTVAPDGSFFVAEHIAKSGRTRRFAMETPPQGSVPIDIVVHKFLPCAQGKALVAKFPVVAATGSDPAVMGGMPRPPEANYTIAAGEGDATGRVVYLTYTKESAVDRDDVHVIRSNDGGRTWGNDVIVNRTHGGHRYFPAICTTGHTAFVSWYDRRAGVGGASSDLTSYYRASLRNDGADLGPELNVTGAGAEDPQCSAGFPFFFDSVTMTHVATGVAEPNAELLCTNLPNANLETGECATSLGLCDLRTQAPCPAGESCVLRDQTAPGGREMGNPNFGDYNGSACARGALFMAWAAARAPQGACATDGTTCAANADCCSGSTCAVSSDGVTRACKSTLGGCAANTAMCATGADCCSGQCQGGVCFAKVGIYNASTACNPHETFGADNLCHACGANQINALNSCETCRFGGTAVVDQDRCTCVAPNVTGFNGNCDCTPGGDPVPGEDRCACRAHFKTNADGTCTDCGPGAIAVQLSDGSWECHSCPDGEQPVDGENRCTAIEPEPDNRCPGLGLICFRENGCACNFHSGPNICTCVAEISCETQRRCDEMHSCGPDCP